MSAAAYHNADDPMGKAPREGPCKYVPVVVVILAMLMVIVQIIIQFTSDSTCPLLVCGVSGLRTDNFVVYCIGIICQFVALLVILGSLVMEVKKLKESAAVGLPGGCCKCCSRYSRTIDNIEILSPSQEWLCLAAFNVSLHVGVEQVRRGNIQHPRSRHDAALHGQRGALMVLVYTISHPRCRYAGLGNR